MTTDPTPDPDAPPSWVAGDSINEYLYQQVADLEKQLRQAREMLGRPINVQVQSPDFGVMQKIEQYLPQLTYIATNISSTASAVQAVNAGQSLIGAKIETNTNMLQRVAEVLEQLIPERPAEGPEADDRYFHKDAGMPWDGRLCKKYGLVWSVHDPGDFDPTNVGDECTVSHKVWEADDDD